MHFLLVTVFVCLFVFGVGVGAGIVVVAFICSNFASENLVTAFLFAFDERLIRL